MERWQKLIKQYIGIYSFKHIFIYPDFNYKYKFKGGKIKFNIQ